MELIGDPKSKLYLFSYEESENIVQIGAKRLFLRIKVMFKACQKLIFENRNHSTEVAFSLQGYFMNSHFYHSPSNLQQYVKYISLLNDWVKGENNTVLFLGQYLDSKHNFENESIAKPSAGWFSNALSPKIWADKRQDALSVSLQNFPKPVTPIYNQTLTLRTAQITAISLASLAISCLLIVLAVYLTRRHYTNRKLTAEEIEKFLNGEKSEGEATTMESAPYDKSRYEIPTGTFSMQNELGSGEFGKVYRGKIVSKTNEFCVAIKTSNSKTFHKTVLSGLLSEIKVLAYIGKHENIVELLGANTENLRNGKVYVFLELCQLGSLDKTLKELSQHVDSKIVDAETTIAGHAYINCQAGTKREMDAALSQDLFKWSTEICKGMAYLAEKHVVHADLATRNVLLNLRKEAKICDFGLSRRMYNYTNYVKCHQEPLPWKWMAPESLNYMTFSEKSDVWAYGITLWEIYSLGKSPYPGLSWDPNFAGMLERGLRLSEPEFNENDMYSVMTKCWATDDKQRPTFLELSELLVNPQVLTAGIAETAV